MRKEFTYKGRKLSEIPDSDIKWLVNNSLHLTKEQYKALSEESSKRRANTAIILRRLGIKH
jgi:hypothetical protein